MRWPIRRSTSRPRSVCFIIVKAREFDVQDVVTDPDSGSNATDDRMISVLEAHSDDPTLQELQAFIAALSEEEQTDLVALMWLGRGDGTLEDWIDLRGEAERQHNNRTAAYLLGEPLLPTISRKACRSSDFRARNSKSTVSEPASERRRRASSAFAV